MTARRLLPLVIIIIIVFLLIGQGNFGTESANNPKFQVKAAPLQQTTPTISFSQTTLNVIEPDAGENETEEINVQISVAPTSGNAAEVTYKSANGSAIAGEDYLPVAGELTFPAGSTAAQTIEITIIGNNIHQEDREFVIFLTNPVNATVGIPGAITITILDNDPIEATSTPTATPGGEVYLDQYEPNNVPETAFVTSANAAKLTDISLWPVGDQDYFAFTGKKNTTYEVFTTDLTNGLDTLLRVYDPDGDKIAENDDRDDTSEASRVVFTAKEDGNYFARITNQDSANSSNRTYSFEVRIITPPTPTPTGTRIGQLDVCEPNNDLGSACLIGPGEVKSGMNFIPPEGTGTDNDFYTMPIKPGILYTCQTQNLSAENDTNIIFLDQNGNDFNPQLGNDDRAPGDLSSLLSYYSTYQGNLIILVGPVNPPSYENSPLFTYDIQCSAQVATPTPIPTPTVVWTGSTGSGTGYVQPTTAPFASPTMAAATPTPIDIASLLPTPVPPPIIDFQPLPTATPAVGVRQTTSVKVTVYYDSNFNYMPELTEGVSDVAVELFDNTTGQLLAFGYTNEAGVILFDAVTSTGAVRIDVPYLNYSMVVVGSSANILLRIEPRNLPSEVP
jgi:hypothetical protein